MNLPGNLIEIDADRVTRMLGRKYPGIHVERLDPGTVIRGTATKVRLLLDFDDAGHAAGLPPTMWFKGGLEAHSAGDDMRDVYLAEALFYRDIAPGLAMTLPKAHAVEIDEATGRSAMLLEDMLARNSRFGHATRPASPRLAANVLGQLARLHGAHWGDAMLVDDAALARGGERLSSFLRTYLFQSQNWERCLALPRGRHVPEPFRDLPAMDAAMQAMLAADRQNGTSLVHGDAHLGNVCILPGEEASFLDWQTVMSGFWAHDISYFLVGALSVADRRMHERELIDHYRRELVAAGGSLDAATAWAQYRAHALYAFCWFVCNPEWQPEEVAAANTERAVTAMIDLDALSFWT